MSRNTNYDNLDTLVRFMAHHPKVTPGTSFIRRRPNKAELRLWYVQKNSQRYSSIVVRNNIPLVTVALRGKTWDEPYKNIAYVVNDGDQHIVTKSALRVEHVFDASKWLVTATSAFDLRWLKNYDLSKLCDWTSLKMSHDIARFVYVMVNDVISIFDRVNDMTMFDTSAGIICVSAWRIHSALSILR